MERVKDLVLSFFAAVIFGSARIICRRKSTEPQRLLIVSLHKLGDTVLTIPAVRCLVEKYGRGNSILLAYEETLPIYEEAFSGSNGMHFTTVRRTDFYFGVIARASVRKVVRKLAPTVIIDLSGGIHSATSVFTSGASEIIGINLHRYRWVYSTFIPISTAPPLREIYLNVCRALNIGMNEANDDTARISKSDPITLFPFAGWPAKEWDSSRMIELGRLLKREYDVQFMAEKGQTEQAMRHELESAKIPLKETRSLNELMDVLRGTSLLIAGDTGPVHVAAMLGKATFCLYGPTNPIYHQWNGAHHASVRHQLDCTPLAEKYCALGGGRNCPHVNCMKELQVDVVYASVKRHIETLQLTGLRASDET